MNRPLRRNLRRVMADPPATHGMADITATPSTLLSSPSSRASTAQKEATTPTDAKASTHLDVQAAAKREAEAKAHASIAVHGHTPSVLGVTKNGVEVVRRHNEHHALAEALLREAIEKAEMPRSDFAEIVVEMGRVVGESHCVPTDKNRLTLFLRREARAWRSKFVVGLPPVQASSIVLVLKRGRGGEVFLVTAYIGEKAGRESGDPKATLADRVFWEDHALRIEAFLDSIAEEDRSHALEMMRRPPATPSERGSDPT